MGCTLSYQRGSPIFKARLIGHAQVQSPPLCSRTSQLMSGRPGTPEAHPSTSTNLQGLGEHCLDVLCQLRPYTAHCGCSQQTCTLDTDSLEPTSVSTDLNLELWAFEPTHLSMQAPHRGSVSSPCSHHCCFAGSRDHHGCPADTTHWCCFNFRHFFSLHGRKKTNTRPFAPGEEGLFV